MLRVVVVGSWLCSPPRCGRRRRVLCSPPPVGSVSMLARARGQTKHEGHTGTSDSSILHQNNVNQTSAFGPWLLLLRRGLAQLQILFLTDSQDCTQRHALLSAQLWPVMASTGRCSSKSRLLHSRAAPMRIGTPASLCARSRGDNPARGSTSPHPSEMQRCAELVCTFAGLPVGQQLL